MKEVFQLNENSITFLNILIYMSAEQLWKHQSKISWEFSYICQQQTRQTPPEDHFKYYYNQVAQSMGIVFPLDIPTIEHYAVVRQEAMNPEEDEEQDQEWSEAKSQPVERRRRRAKKQPYPTKNFLPLFKPHILSYIKTHYKKHKEHGVLRRIQAKSSISLQDYQELFNTPEFRDILAYYFQSKKIYRDLLQSRIDYDRKRLYFKKIDVFEQAFLSGKFEKIN